MVARSPGATYDVAENSVCQAARYNNFWNTGSVKKMISALRKRSGGIVVKSLLVLLIISFAAWGIEDWLNPAISGNTVATVGSEEVGAYEVRRRVNQEVSRLRQLFGNDFTVEQAMAFGIVDGIVNEQVNQALINQGAAKLGVTISDELVSSDIRAQDGFKGLAGKFDRIRFNQVLASNGLSEADYVNTIRRSLSGLQYTESFQSGTRAPKVLIDTIFKFRNEKRVVDVALISDSRFSDIPEPNSAEIEAFHKENEKDFTAPEYRKVTVLSLIADDLATEMAVTEIDVQEYYDNHAEEFETIERRNLLQIVLNDEATAQAAHKQLMDGRDFASVAKEVAGLDPAALDLGMITKLDLLPELADPAFNLMQGTVSGPVKSALGWHLLKVTEIEAGGIKTLDEVREQLKTFVAREKAVDSLYELSNALEDELGSGSTIQEAANSMNLKAVSIPAVSAAGQDLNGNAVSGIPSGPAFIRTVFATDEGQDSALTESGTDGFFVVRVDSIIPPTVRPLTTVQIQVSDAWKAGQRREKAKALAEKLTAELNAGGSIAAIATANGVTFSESAAFTREVRGTESTMGEVLVTEVFKLTGTSAAHGRSADGYQVAVLNKIIAADPFADKAALDTLRASLTGALQGDVTQQLVLALREDIGVDVDRAMVDQLFIDRASSRNY